MILLWQNPFTVERHRLHSPLYPEECIRRTWGGRHSFLTSSELPVNGSIWGRRFLLWKKLLPEGGWFRILASGTIDEAPDGATIMVNIGIFASPWSRVFLIFWFALLGILAFLPPVLAAHGIPIHGFMMWLWEMGLFCLLILFGSLFGFLRFAMRDQETYLLDFLCTQFEANELPV